MWCCGAGDDEGRGDNSGGDLRAEMLKFGSKSDVTVVHRATIRLLDDAEIIHCDFQVRQPFTSDGTRRAIDDARTRASTPFLPATGNDRPLKQAEGSLLCELEKHYFHWKFLSTTSLHLYLGFVRAEQPFRLILENNLYHRSHCQKR